MRYLYGLALLCAIVLWSSCRNDFETEPSTGNLEFSKDTVYLDTIFTNIGSSTYNLRVYNRSDEDIHIPSVRLGQGENSNYRLNVDGVAGKVFEDVQILAKDSIYIFVETTVDILEQTNDLQFLYTDQILFDSGANEQNVELVTLVQDAVFLFPELDDDGMVGTIVLGQNEEGEDVTIEGFVLDQDELTFTNEKPYVIYGYAAVPSNETLTIEAGARIHFHRDSGILVANEGSIHALGGPSNDPVLLENEIIIEGDRLEPDFSDIPGQWGTIWLTIGSNNNIFNYTTIRNSIVGILVDQTSDVTLNNVQIYNSSNVGLFGRNGNVIGNNMVINNSGQSSLACTLGGIYNFNHSTFANYWTNSFRSFPTVQIDNIIPGSDEGADLIAANFTNCLIYGNERRELGIFKVEDPSAQFNFNFTNSLIRFEDPQGDFEDDPNYDFSNPVFYTNSVFNIDPVFQNTDRNNFNIEQGTSGAEGIGLGGVNPGTDLNGTPRDGSAPDAGAYEATVFPDDDGD
ncbi:right-handed parallel beta-helix repeat-containing protein [Aureisphaera galaxeae]|uniref:right-handed parallel beta-helix repeat-containing protein n=1 Tax=Aureisphaera galaxeae TaxID=1538023 RepID=UPI0023500C95|nr:right-handed parallel beta-helix repeat-containing protein [Aureisphaera galaxeae]MDC8004922.1 right-handed parallel beta-helix repeat-containing protein [Aureisphaera galaxeae]